MKRVAELFKSIADKELVTRGTLCALVCHNLSNEILREVIADGGLEAILKRKRRSGKERTRATDRLTQTAASNGGRHQEVVCSTESRGDNTESVRGYPVLSHCGIGTVGGR